MIPGCDRVKYIPALAAYITAASVLCAAHPAGAAPTYGTHMPKKGGTFIGYQDNLVFKHDLNDSYGNIKSEQHFLDLSYGVYDWLTVDGKAGLGNLLQKGGIHPKVYYDYGFAGGYGFRMRLLEDEKNRIRITAGFHHISVHPVNRNLNGDKYESLLDDWQCSLAVSRSIGALNPFVGAKLARCDLVYKINEIDRKRRPPAYYAGIVAGCDWEVLRGFSVGIEGHFIDESSLSAGAHYQF